MQHAAAGTRLSGYCRVETGASPSQQKTPLSILLKDGNDPRYHLGWGARPPLCRRRPHDRGRGRVPMTGDSTGQPYCRGLEVRGWRLVFALPTPNPYPQPLVLGGDSGGAFGAGPPSSLHYPRLAGCPARRLLLHRRRRSISICARHSTTRWGRCQSVKRWNQGNVNVAMIAPWGGHWRYRRFLVLVLFLVLTPPIHHPPRL